MGSPMVSSLFLVVFFYLLDDCCVSNDWNAMVEIAMMQAIFWMQRIKTNRFENGFKNLLV